LGRELDGIAQYNPASATMVSRTFSTVFIGGVSLRAFLRVAKYMPGPCFVRSEILMDNSDFLMVSAAAEWSARRGKRPNLTRSHRGVNERQKWVAFCRLQTGDVFVLLVEKCSHAVQISEGFGTPAGGGGEGSAAVSVSEARWQVRTAKKLVEKSGVETITGTHRVHDGYRHSGSG